MAVAFLITRVHAPGDNNWGKLKCVLKYLKETRGLKSCISVNDLSIIKWLVDDSYATHDDCKGHRKLMISLGKDATTSSPSKHKIQGKCFMESKNIAIHDTLPQVL